MSVYFECNKCCWPAPHSGTWRQGDSCPESGCDGHLTKTTDAEELEHDDREFESYCDEEED